MKCPICNTENAPQATSCKQCGFGLGLTQSLWPDANAVDSPDLEEVSQPSELPSVATPPAPAKLAEMSAEEALAAWEALMDEAQAETPPTAHEPEPTAPTKDMPDWLASLASEKTTKASPPKPDPRSPPWLASLQETAPVKERPRSNSSVRLILLAALLVPLMAGLGIMLQMIGKGQARSTPQAPATATAQSQATATAMAQRALLYGPVDGELEHEQNYVGIHYVNANPADFIAEVRFYNPYDPSEGGWDYGFGFRDTASASEYRLYVNSDPAWYLDLITEQDGEIGFNTLASGELTNLDLSPNGSNRLWLEVNGPSASLYVNGEYVTQLDVSDKQINGGLWVGTNFVEGYGINGRSTRFGGLSVWSFATHPQATATAQALQATATAMIPEASLVYGPANGELEHLESGFVPQLDAEVNLRDFIAEVRFYNPYERSRGEWDYGLGFRDAGSDENYRLYVDSNGDWSLESVTVWGEEAYFDSVVGGHLDDLDVSTGGSNHLRLIVQGDTALFFVNGEYVSTLDVSARNLHGGVWIGTGFEIGREIPGESTRYEGFSLWSLDVGRLGVGKNE